MPNSTRASRGGVSRPPTRLSAVSCRSIGSQRINGNFIVTGCDFGETKETSHIARALSFGRKPSVRSFCVGADRPVPGYYDPIPSSRHTTLSRSNAVRLSPLQYIRHVFARVRMRMRLRRQSQVSFKQKAGTRKRKYLLEASTSTYQYRVRTRDLFRRTPKVASSGGISAPMNAFHGPEALALAEQGKNQKFNITTSNLHCSNPATITVPVPHKELPRRFSQRPPSPKSPVLPDPPEEFVHGYSASEYDDFENLYNQRPGGPPGKSPGPAPEPAPEPGSEPVPELIPSTAHSHSHARQHRAKLAEDPVDIEDALDFVNAWGSYLQNILALRVIKERESKLREHDETHYVNYHESDDSSVFSEDAHGIYDSCTSDCFAQGSSSPQRTTTEDESPEPVSLRRAQASTRAPAAVLAAVVEQDRSSLSPLPPMPPPHLPRSTRRVSGPRPMKSKDTLSTIPKDTVHPLQISPRRFDSPNASSVYFTPIIGRHRLGSTGERIHIRGSDLDGGFSSSSEDLCPINSSWIEKSASPASKSSNRMSEGTPSRYRHGHNASRSSNESENTQLLAQYRDPLVHWSGDS